jgi:ribosomal protein L34E
MNSKSDRTASMNETGDDESTSIDDDMRKMNFLQSSERHIARSSAGSTSSNGTTTNHSMKRPKEISPCHVCGAKAHGYNFDQSNQMKRLINCYLIT